jgi:hypothetical protein
MPAEIYTNYSYPPATSLGRFFDDAERCTGLACKENVLGPKHPETLQTVQNFGGRREELNILQIRFPWVFMQTSSTRYAELAF